MNLNQVTVPVTELMRSIAFYEKLGLKLIVRSEPDYARFECTEGGASFSLHRVDKMPEGEGVWVYFEREDIDNYVEELEKRHISFETKPADQPWLWREAKLRDPDGNMLIIYWAGTDRLYPPWRLKE
ncbi:MAG TPA: VOC family protein [Flavipsychrobacter sp.]|nr:VOC family protein [Flavipsychrobacter sp.]